MKRLFKILFFLLLFPTLALSDDKEIILEGIPDRYISDMQREGDYPLFDLHLLINNFYDSPDEYIGKKISTIGFVSLDSTYDLSIASFALERYFITCCIYHAKPVMVYIISDTNTNFKSEQWLRINGEISELNTRYGKTIAIKAEKIEIVPEPEQPYLNFENRTGH